MRNIKLFCFLLFCPFFLTFCGGSETFLDSLELGACFSDASPSELENRLAVLNQAIEEVENPNYESIAIAGCYNYQLGNHVLAEKWLNIAFNQDKNKEVKSVAAASLGLIYLKHRQVHKIKPYIAAAAQVSLGRWMLILYHIDYYQSKESVEYLSFAARTLEAKHREDGITLTSSHFLKSVQSIRKMDEHCIINPDGESCSVPDLNEQRNLLQKAAVGQLAFLLKEPPFQRTESEEQQSVELTAVQ